MCKVRINFQKQKCHSLFPWCSFPFHPDKTSDSCLELKPEKPAAITERGRWGKITPLRKWKQVRLMLIMKYNCPQAVSDWVLYHRSPFEAASGGDKGFIGNGVQRKYFLLQEITGEIPSFLTREVSVSFKLKPTGKSEMYHSLEFHLQRPFQACVSRPTWNVRILWFSAGIPNDSSMQQKELAHFSSEYLGEERLREGHLSGVDVSALRNPFKNSSMV